MSAQARPAAFVFLKQEKHCYFATKCFIVIVIFIVLVIVIVIFVVIVIVIVIVKGSYKALSALAKWLDQIDL